MPHNDLTYELDVAMLGKAISAYESHFNVTIIPFAADPHPAAQKYFSFKENDADAGCLVDIHIHRKGLEICAKQDLDFGLPHGDLIELGPLAC